MGDQLSEDQLEEIIEVFELFVTDNTNGQPNQEKTMPVHDLGNAMRALGMIPTEAELQEMMKDRVPDETMTQEEFVNEMAKNMPKEGKEEELVNALKYFDKDNSHYISAVDLRAALINFGEKLSDEEVNEMMLEANVDKDGRIDYEAFAKDITSN